MDLGQIKDGAGALKKDIEEIAVTHVKYYKLWLFRFIVRLLTNIFWGVLFAVSFFFAFVFIAVAGALVLSDYLDSMPLGFLIVGIVFILVVFLIYVLARKYVNRLWLRKLSEIYFQE